VMCANGMMLARAALGVQNHGCMAMAAARGLASAWCCVVEALQSNVVCMPLG
jgi:hypothetical protein